MNHLTALARSADRWRSTVSPPSSALSDAELIEAQTILAALRRDIDARAADVAGEIARRSRPESGYDGLAQRLGARTPQELVRTVTGLGAKDASTLVAVGDLMSSARESSPAWVRAVRDAVRAGMLSAPAAEVVRRALGGLVLPEGALLSASEELIAAAASMDVDRLAAHARHVRDRLDAEGVSAREEQLREQRFIRFTPQPNGMTRVFGMLDPESAAEVRAVYDAATSPRRGGPRFTDSTSRQRERRLRDDPRTIDQIGLDAIVECIKLGVETVAPEMVGARRPAIRIHVTAHDLARGAGAARIEGQDAAVSIATAKRHACTVGGIPIEFDTDGQVVNVGRAQRLFTTRQRIGLAARDGGCRFPDCDRPPSWCEAHHIDEWLRDRGSTDIADGVLLCRHHHLLVHNNGWKVHRDGADYYVTPPPSIDRDRRPVPAPPKAQLPFACSPTVTTLPLGMVVPPDGLSELTVELFGAPERN